MEGSPLHASDLNGKPLHTVAESHATAGRFFDEAYDYAARTARVAETLVEGTVVGAVEYGIDQAEHHLPKLLIETGTMAALGAATVGGMIAAPAIAAPIIEVIGVAGTLIMLGQIGSEFWSCTEALGKVWNSPDAEADAVKVVGDHLGSYAFDATVGTLAGIAGGFGAYEMGLGVTAATGACEGAVVCPIKTIKVGQVSNAGSNATSIPDIPVTAATLARLAQRYLPEFLPQPIHEYCHIPPEIQRTDPRTRSQLH